MGTFFVYILKTSICLTGFYLFYRLLLSKETFHRFNRVALLGILLLSQLIPFCEITVPEESEVQQTLLTIEQILTLADHVPQTEVEVLPSSIPLWLPVLLCIYLLGILFFLGRNLYSLSHMLRLLHGGRQEKLEKGITLIIHDKNIAPFSWMKYVVISEKDLQENGKEILIHEMAHVHNRHSIDLLISEICILFHWFNPSVWLLRQELQNIHEYEADESVLNQGVDAKRYQLLLIKKAVGAQRFTSMANSFNHSSLKKRIAMMLKQKSSPWARLKYLYVLPLAALTVVAFARPEISHELEKISSVKISEIIPVQEKKEPKRNVEVETLARDSVVSEKDMQAIQEKVSAVMEKYQPEIDKAVEEAVKAANIDEIVSAEMAKHQAEIDKAVQAAIEAAKINETIAAEMEKIQPEINRAIEEAMKAIDINEKAAKEASKEKSSFSGIVYIDGMESSKERMDNLNPDRIASMNVYKGNEAIAKFGEKGRNGVIEIKLKK